MEREESVAGGDIPPGGVFAHSGGSIIGSASTSDVTIPAQLWRDAMNRWIGSHNHAQASWTRGGRDAPPVCWRHDALDFLHSGDMTGIAGGANVTDCTTGGEPCAPMS
jgi:hypothetical protein